MDTSRAGNPTWEGVTDQSFKPPDAAEGTSLVSMRGVSKRYRALDQTVTAVDDVSMEITEGTVVALTGPSGSGKSTILHLIGALDRPDDGTITVAGEEITQLKSAAAADYRRGVGFVFQRFNLLPTLTVEDNVIAGLLPVRVDFDRRARAIELIAAVGLAGRERTLATRLSGGQQQRVAIARAMLARPSLLLADEPTGNLDSKTSQDVLDLLFGLRDSLGTTLVIATHDSSVSSRCDRVLAIRDGVLDQQVASRRPARG